MRRVALGAPFTESPETRTGRLSPLSPQPRSESLTDRADEVAENLNGRFQTLSTVNILHRQQTLVA